MKKLLLSLVLCALFTNLSAQEIGNRLSLNAGVGITKDVGYDSPSNDERAFLSYAFGLNYHIKLKGPHHVTTGVEYMQIGDTYNYYTGFNSTKSDMRIYAHALKVPMLYAIQWDDKNSNLNAMIRVGATLDFYLGESVINSEKNLNSPDGIRDYIPQGRVANETDISLYGSLGFVWDNKNDIPSGYLEFIYNGSANIYNTDSKYNVWAVKIGFFLTYPKVSEEG